MLTEGVAAGHDGVIYFSDITRTFDCTDARGAQAGHIWRYDPASDACRIFRSPSGMANGLAFDAAGDLVAVEGADHGGRRVTRTDMATGRAFIVATGYGGRPFNAPNDVWIDLAGRLWVTDPRYFGHEPVWVASGSMRRTAPWPPPSRCRCCRPMSSSAATTRCVVPR